MVSFRCRPGALAAEDPVTRALCQLLLAAPAFALTLFAVLTVERAGHPTPPTRIVEQISPQVAAVAARSQKTEARAAMSSAAAVLPAEAPREATANAVEASSNLDAPPATVRSNSPRVLRDVRIAAGLRLVGDGTEFDLADIKPLGPDAKCKRLDGAVVDCAERAAARLEIVTRGRAVQCNVVGENVEGRAIASCAAGKIDLAEDLVKNGLALRL